MVGRLVVHDRAGRMILSEQANLKPPAYGTERSIADPSETVFQWEMNCALDRECVGIVLYSVLKSVR